MRGGRIVRWTLAIVVGYLTYLAVGLLCLIVRYDVLDAPRDDEPVSFQILQGCLAGLAAGAVASRFFPRFRALDAVILGWLWTVPDIVFLVSGESEGSFGDLCPLLAAVVLGAIVGGFLLRRGSGTAGTGRTEPGAGALR